MTLLRSSQLVFTNFYNRYVKARDAAESQSNANLNRYCAIIASELRKVCKICGDSQINNQIRQIEIVFYRCTAVATGRTRGLRYRALPPRGSRWHACNNASVGYLDRTSFYLFHLHPSCGLLSRVKLDECETSRSTYTEQIHTYPELIHVFAWVSLL